MNALAQTDNTEIREISNAKSAPKVRNIAAALAAAQATMGKAIKDSSNPHFRSKYADLGSVMDACMPAMNAQGIAVIQPTGEDEAGRYVETLLIHGESGETLKCRVPLIVAKNDMQGYGSAVTYARRYGLMTMAGVAPEDDDGNAAAKAAPKRQEPKGPTAQDLTQAREYLADASDLDDLKARWGNLPRATQADVTVIAAKDATKDRLTAPQDRAASDGLNGDQIPY